MASAHKIWTLKFEAKCDARTEQSLKVVMDQRKRGLALLNKFWCKATTV